MAATFELEIATPERLLFKEQVSEAQIPAANGFIGVLPGHAPLISELGIGELSYSAGSGKQTLVISKGWVEVYKDHVRVLTDSARQINEIDVKKAQDDLKKAQEQLAGATDQESVTRDLESIRLAQVQIESKK